MKRLSLLAAVFLIGSAHAAPQTDLAKGKEIAEKICAACHAADGNSGIDMYPKLSAQHASFIFRETKAIKEGKRTTGASAAMAPMVQNLSDDDIRHVAAYFTKQIPKAGEANPKQNPNVGKKIYHAGIPEKNIPACMSCHGPAGAGLPAGGTAINAFPRIGGQHAKYVVEQLKNYATGKRMSHNGMMEDITKRMNEEDMQSVANYIQGLH